MVEQKVFDLKAVIGLYSAKSDGEDITILDESGSKISTFHCLRQQEETDVLF